MATEFKIPNLGDGIKGGDVLNVLVKVGDTVAKDQGVLELETDKATIEVPSSVGGHGLRDQGQERRQGDDRPGRADADRGAFAGGGAGCAGDVTCFGAPSGTVRSRRGPCRAVGAGSRRVSGPAFGG